MVHEVKLTAVVVVHNLSLSESESLTDLMSMDGWHEIIVCDNSAEPDENRREAERLAVTYLSMGGNAGLPKAYNRAIRAASGDLIALFDSDTHAPADYPHLLCECAAAHPECALFFPMVYDNSGLLSPCAIRGGRTHRLDPSRPFPDKPSAINSGLAVRTAAARSVLYEEALFLDYADHDFISRCYTEKMHSAVFPARLSQQFSGTSRALLPAALARFRIFSRDIRTFGRLHRCRMSTFLTLLRHAFALCARYRTAAFLRKSR